MTKGLAQRFTELALTNDYNRVILERLPALGVSDCWLVAGCLYQAVWNAQVGQPLATGRHGRHATALGCEEAGLPPWPRGSGTLAMAHAQNPPSTTPAADRKEPRYNIEWFEN